MASCETAPIWIHSFCNRILRHRIQEALQILPGHIYNNEGEFLYRHLKELLFYKKYQLHHHNWQVKGCQNKLYEGDYFSRLSKIDISFCFSVSQFNSWAAFFKLLGQFFTLLGDNSILFIVFAILLGS